MDRDESLAAIEAARHRKMTPAQWEEQRRSFAYGNVAIENPTITRAMIDEAAEPMNREREQTAEK